MTAPAVVQLSSFLIQGPYPVVIPHCGNETVARLVEAGNYDRRSVGATDENFPDLLVGDEAVDLYLALCNRETETDENLAMFEREGFRADGMSGLLTLGAKNPNLQWEFPIVEIGQLSQTRNGQFAGVLHWKWEGSGLRELALHREYHTSKAIHRWPRPCRFVVRQIT